MKETKQLIIVRLFIYIQSGATFAGSVQSAPAINGTMANLEKLQRQGGCWREYD